MTAPTGQRVSEIAKCSECGCERYVRDGGTCLVCGYTEPAEATLAVPQAPKTEIPVRLFMVEGDHHLWDDAEGAYWVRESELNQMKLALKQAESRIRALEGKRA